MLVKQSLLQTKKTEKAGSENQFATQHSPAEAKVAGREDRDRELARNSALFCRDVCSPPSRQPQHPVAVRSRLHGAGFTEPAFRSQLSGAGFTEPVLS